MKQEDYDTAVCLKNSINKLEKLRDILRVETQKVSREIQSQFIENLETKSFMSELITDLAVLTEGNDIRLGELIANSVDRFTDI